MNLTDKEVTRFRAVVNSLLEELPKLVPTDFQVECFLRGLANLV